MRIIKTITGLSIFVMLIFPTLGYSMNGFDLSGSEVPPGKIYAGGPPRDGIPAINSPHFLNTRQAGAEITDDMLILGVEIAGVSRAYPIAILNWHEIVNDEIAGDSLAITYCPLCGSGMAFLSRSREGKQLRFGVSGLLYNSDMLLYDRETESLWSQLLGKAISGPMVGERLKQVPVTHTTWKNWKERHPDTVLLSKETGFRRDYGRDPYAGYSDEAGTYFPVERIDPRYHPKERVLGLEIEGKYKVYPYSELSRSDLPVVDRFNGAKIRIDYDPALFTK